jgi:hypothetical protein
VGLCTLPRNRQGQVRGALHGLRYARAGGLRWRRLGGSP